MVISLGRDSPFATVVVHSARLLRELAWRPDPLRLAEAYFRGEMDVEGERGAIGVYQILAANRREGFVDLPLTRGELLRTTRGSSAKQQAESRIA